MSRVLQERKNQVAEKGASAFGLECEKRSLEGSVSQRACVFCGARVVLYPIADALHLVHGPIGCAAYTWDIRGSLSSGPQLHRLSFSTDLQEHDVIYGGEPKLARALDELIPAYRPRAVFVYSTCIVGVIGDDVERICRQAAERSGIPVIPVHSEGFKGTKKDGYAAACDALLNLIGTGDISDLGPVSVNILGEFNLAGETWMIRNYYERLGVDVVSVLTGDGRVEDIRKAHGARLNVVQCSGSMTRLAEKMQKLYGIPYIRVSYFGLEDTAQALYDVADFFGSRPEIAERARALVREEIQAVAPQLQKYRESLQGRKAAIYVGGAFKTFSLLKALRMLGMRTVVVGSQTGNRKDYQRLQEACDEGTIILDDSNPVELSRFIQEKQADLFIGGVKERPIAYKLGIGFCDHNHERKEALAGFSGMLNFAREVYASVNSPVWTLIREGRFRHARPQRS